MRWYKVSLFLLVLLTSIQPLEVFSQQKANRKFPYLELINTKTNKKIVIDSGRVVRVEAFSSIAKKVKPKVVKAYVSYIGNNAIQFKPKKEKYESITYSYTESPSHDKLTYLEIATPGSFVEGFIVNGFIVVGVAVVAVILFIPAAILTGGHPENLSVFGSGGKPMKWHSFRKRINLSATSDWMIHVVVQ